MVATHLSAATIAGIDLHIQRIKNTYFRIVIREAEVVDGADCVKLSEIREAKPRLICIAPPRYASLCLIGWMEELEIEKER